MADERLNDLSITISILSRLRLSPGSEQPKEQKAKCKEWEKNQPGGKNRWVIENKECSQCVRLVQESSCPEWGQLLCTNPSDPWFASFPKITGMWSQTSSSHFSSLFLFFAWPLLQLRTVWNLHNWKVCKSCTKPICWDVTPNQSPLVWVFGNSTRLTLITQPGSSAWG